MHNSALDGIVLPIDVSYNRVAAGLSNEPRYIRGKNCFVNLGGVLSRRPGTVPLATGAFNLRVDRAWNYETLDTPPKVFLVASAFNPTTSKWELWYQEESSPFPGAWTQFPAYRDCNLSIRPHEAVISRGLLFIKSYPAPGSTEKLGSVIFNGTGGTPLVQPWGALGPATPARLASAVVTTLSANATSGATTVTVTSAAGFPAAPFVIQVDFEQMNVTAVVGTTFTVTRAFNGTAAAAHFAGTSVIYRNWTASAHPIVVNIGWKYSYGYISITNNYTNRAPFETNPDNLPSSTGPFFNQQPQITVQGLADTTNFPKIAIYRTTDGGNTPLFLTSITNTGVGPIVFTDNLLTSNAGQADPEPDNLLNAQDYAPDLVSNSPPPTCLAPKVTGVDAPQATTPIANYAGRLWYGIGNVLFYSGNEEINRGVPEEDWPSGTNGNFFRFNNPITNVKQTDAALYVFTIQNVYYITGTTKETFAAQLLFDNYGHPYGHPRAITVFGNTIGFLTQDYRVAMINNTSIEVVSDVLFSDLVDSVNTNGCEFDFAYYADLDKEWIFVTGQVQNNPTNTRQWVLDIKRSNHSRSQQEWMPYFWYVPWTIPSTAQVSGRLAETSSQRRMAFFLWNPTTLLGQWVRIDPTVRTATDYLPGVGAANFDLDIVYSLIQNPAGNHVNERRVPQLQSVVYSTIMDRTVFAGDVDPNFYYFLDDFWTNPLAQNLAYDPARRPQSLGFKTIEYPIYNIVHNFAWEVTKVNSPDLFEIQRMSVIFAPDSGA